MIRSYDPWSDLTIHDPIYLSRSYVRSQFWQPCWRMKHSFETDWRKKMSALCNIERKKKMWFSFAQETQEIWIGVFSRTIIWVLQPHRVEVFGVENLTTKFCGEVVFVSRDIVVFSQLIINLGFGYNLSVVISILL